MKQIQKIVGSNPDGIFGRNTAKSIQSYYKLTSLEAAHLLGQCAHESGGFKVYEENLNYSSKRLLEVFPKYFDNLLAFDYGFKPEMIANRVYANRMGNGPEESGDGWRHRGFGPIQLTGKNNHKEFAKYINEPEVLCNPKLIAEQYPIESAIFFFTRNNIFKYCTDISDQAILTVSRAVNVGNPNSRVIPHGMPSRRNWTKKIYSWLIG